MHMLSKYIRISLFNLARHRYASSIGGLSKSRILSGHQCPLLLWNTIHEPDAPELEISPELQAVFDNGHRVGKAAMESFPNGVLIQYESNKSLMVEATKRAMESESSLIYEASFTHDGIFVAVDVLERNTDNDCAWNIIEVKSTNSVKKQHIFDVAVQIYVLESQGVTVDQVDVLTLNKDYEISNTSVFSDIKINSSSHLKLDCASIDTLNSITKTERRPKVTPGKHCKKPYLCPFYNRCNQTGIGNIDELYRKNEKLMKILRFREIDKIEDIPSDISLSAIQKRQVESHKENKLVIQPGLEKELSKIIPPVAFMNVLFYFILFSNSNFFFIKILYLTISINSVIPIWPHVRPYGQVAVQVSVHYLSCNGELSHIEWLSEDANDPRPKLAATLVKKLKNVKTFVASSFEKRVIHDLSRFLPPKDADILLSMNDKFVDLLPVIRNYVYHPNFHGSFSLKKVLPALIPDMSYEDLDVHGGQLAAVMLEKFIMTKEYTGKERRKVRKSLLEYCERDTLALVELTKTLRSLF
eukprot:GSMAST32.ASY1.ANO1.2500.1 assembled CDS